MEWDFKVSKEQNFSVTELNVRLLMILKYIGYIVSSGGTVLWIGNGVEGSVVAKEMLWPFVRYCTSHLWRNCKIIGNLCDVVMLSEYGAELRIIAHQFAVNSCLSCVYVNSKEMCVLTDLNIICVLLQFPVRCWMCSGKFWTQVQYVCLGRNHSTPMAWSSTMRYHLFGALLEHRKACAPLLCLIPSWALRLVGSTHIKSLRKFCLSDCVMSCDLLKSAGMILMIHYARRDIAGSGR